MPIDRETILSEVLKAARELGEDIEVQALIEAEEDTPLVGAKSGVDSISLVNLIADVEEHLSSQLNLDLVLADERAMSQRHSPFRRIGTLVDYICELHSETPS